MPKSLSHHYKKKWVEAEYINNPTSYLSDFAIQFADANRQNRKETLKRLKQLLSIDRGLLVRKRSRDDETGTFIIEKKDQCICQDISLNCPLLAHTITVQDCNTVLDTLCSFFFCANQKEVYRWEIAANGNEPFILLPSQAKYICIQADGNWLKPTPQTTKVILGSLIKTLYQQFYQSIPKDKKKTFKLSFNKGQPNDVFVNYYPRNCYGSAGAHKDNVSYGSTVTQLTLNNHSGLFYVPGAAYKATFPLSLEQGKTICIFQGVEHQVIWNNQPEIRVTIVCRF
jgi:hypothetical protein